jgi:hypothetical protein
MIAVLMTQHQPAIQSFAAFAERIRAKNLVDHGLVIAVDGQSASGKTTFSTRLAASLNAPLVHTDDVASHHSFFDWWPLLIEHVLVPFRAGHAINWTPEAWINRGREGGIVVPTAPVLVVEGVSASRRELMHLIDVAIWMDVDPNLAEHRGLERDGPKNRAFWFEWQAEEVPFLNQDQPWERANLIVDGAPTVEHDPATQYVVISDRLA